MTATATAAEITAPTGVRLLPATATYSRTNRRYAVEVPHGEAVYLYTDEIVPDAVVAIVFEDASDNVWWGHSATVASADPGDVQAALNSLTEGRTGKAAVATLPAR